MAAIAATPATAVMRRTPVLSAPSLIMANERASWLDGKCVPPQNSTLAPRHFTFVGSARSCAIVAPIETTRTGSGYFSPNTARTPAIFLACSSGAFAASTTLLLLMCAITNFSTPAISSLVIARVNEKSKRRRSSATKLPRCCTSSPRVSRSAQFIKCVAV